MTILSSSINIIRIGNYLGKGDFFNRIKVQRSFAQSRVTNRQPAQRRASA
jgi:hypothetical protein